jgi:signal transduction histidine kinase
VVVEYLFPSDPDFSFSADSRKLVRVIVNLVKNAWEKLLDDESGLIEISFVPDHTDLVIRVYDNGSPIPESVLPNLFQAFQTEGKLDGTGLGLAISQRMVELHGGTIQVENCPEDQGVFFEIRLPGCVPTKRVAEKRVA